MVVSPIQTAFNAGELSPRARLRVESELRRRGLGECRNFIPLPQGPLLMRAGSWFYGEEDSAPRLVAFRLSGTADDFVIALTNEKLRIYSKAGLVHGIGPELVVNGTFAAPNGGEWTTVSGAFLINNGFGFLLNSLVGGAIVRTRVRQAIPVVAGQTYRLTGRIWAGSALAHADFARLRLGTTAGGGELLDRNTVAWTETFSFDFTAPVGVATVYFDVENRYEGGNDRASIDDISLRDLGAVIELVTPWTSAQLEELQFVGEAGKDRVFFAHPEVAPQVLTFTAPATWVLAPLGLVGAPASWAGANWPGVCELFQGRLLLGATPGEPHTFWGSKAGVPTTFTLPAVNPDDPYSWIVSTKGRIRWMQGQKALLIGSETVESSAAGSDGLITASDVDIRDESAFGSAAVQGLHTGDQVLWVTRDRRNVRAVSYSLQDDGWVSRALTFLAEHITDGLIRELHFARSPVPTIFALLRTGTLVACTYDRGEQVVAWWRVVIAGTVASAAVAEGPDGSELWIAVERANGVVVERLPLHEVGVSYVDSAVSGVVAGDGTFAGLDHLEGETVRVIVDGALQDDQDVAGGEVALDVELAGKAIVVGLPYTARAKTLPLEGGNPRGSSQGAKRRFAKVGLALNDSALPLLVVGDKRWRVAPDRTPATPQDTPEPRFTGNAKAAALGWDEDGQITIEQDLPFRTEVLAIYGVAAVNEV
jgi:hypothetical protein